MCLSHVVVSRTMDYTTPPNRASNQTWQLWQLVQDYYTFLVLLKSSIVKINHLIHAGNLNMYQEIIVRDTIVRSKKMDLEKFSPIKKCFLPEMFQSDDIYSFPSSPRDIFPIYIGMCLPHGKLYWNNAKSICRVEENVNSHRIKSSTKKVYYWVTTVLPVKLDPIFARRSISRLFTVPPRPYYTAQRRDVVCVIHPRQYAW